MTGIRQEVGRRGEDLAAQWLTDHGMEVLQRNWRCHEGELDIIARTSEGTVVICEIKCRTGLGYGGPLEAITYDKVRRLRQLAGIWAREYRVRGRVRIDAIGILDRRGHTPRITHVAGIG